MEAGNPYAPPSAPVRDIPQEGTGFELASQWIRLGAMLLEVFICGVIIYIPAVIFMLVVGPGNLPVVNGEVDPVALLTSRVVLSLLPGLLIYVAVTLWLVARNGQTIGKKLLGIKVVRTNGDKAGLGRIFWLRNAVISVIALIPVAGWAVAIIDPLLIFRASRKCLHDQIADTIVIRS